MVYHHITSHYLFFKQRQVFGKRGNYVKVEFCPGLVWRMPSAELCSSNNLEVWTRQTGGLFITPASALGHRSSWYMAWTSPVRVVVFPKRSRALVVISFTESCFLRQCLVLGTKGHEHSVLVLILTDFHGFPESSDNIMGCRWWNPPIPYYC